MKSFIKTIAFGTLITCSAAAVADQNDFKVMVIEAQTAPIHLEQTFNSCALNVKSKNYEQAEEVCTKALAILQESSASSYKVRELTSFALSNRGVARLKAHNDTAAIADLYEAVQTSDNELVSHNLKRAKQTLSL
ncbi:hypothetical protein J8L70_08045 [Pseudoalteromonas sp. MMG010]|uniref:hypothetical protein n=1 Tax=Pseudoalteromonas sp. MMG010 TaxID=2822685 RepID=UPI001B3A1D30|nr:hypothetical protein [Pseudoalteromonas sp. MMG010]MBQ4833189.1 hypothetical protein [Pseudoalteromonas sp. MMG010]